MAIFTKTSDDPKDRMLQFLMKQTGMDETDLLIEMSKDRIHQLINTGHTIGEMNEIAKEEGFAEAWNAMKVTDLFSGKKSKEPSASTGRLTKAEIGSLTEAIQGYLRDNPRSRIGDISSAVGFDAAKIRPQLAKLKGAGVVFSEGEKRDTTYSLK